MACSENFKIQSLGGKWTMDKQLTCQTDPLLKLQGISWITRKTIGLATVYLEISVYNTECSKTSASFMNIDVSQTATGSLAGITERRKLDWKMQIHTDYIFGELSCWSQLIGGARDEEGNMRPDFVFQTRVNDESVIDFLKGRTMHDGTRSDGFMVDMKSAEIERTGSWVHTFARNERSGWTTEQASTTRFSRSGALD
ncbi:hypothetical protein N7490_011556 [Penicillium lividum]|nr:hypothetical protein N7490_011556 [Penicillium lividum]